MIPPLELLTQAEALFLDFDGPLAALMPPPANQAAAVAVRASLGSVDLPMEIMSTRDHLAVLRWARANCDTSIVRAEAACTRAEIEAAQTCVSGVHAASLLSFAHARGIPVAIVSNNSKDAVRAFLVRMDWLGHVPVLACRTSETIDWMKPSPRLLQFAADALHIDVTRAIFVGDAVTDVIAAKAAGTPIIALAKNAQRSTELSEAGADAIASLHTPRCTSWHLGLALSLLVGPEASRCERSDE